MPAISKKFLYVAQQEHQLSGNTSLNLSLEPKENSINAVKTVCDFCGRVRHTKNVCYSKHGIPSNYDGKNKGNNTRSGKTCTHCGKNGHTVDICYRKHGFPLGYKFYNGKTTANNIVAVDSRATDYQIQHQESQEAICFSLEQYKALLALIQQPSFGNTAFTKPQVK